MPSAPYYLTTIPKRALGLFGKMLALGRKERKWRQQDVAERIGVSRQTIAHIEQGNPTVAIGYYFSVAWLLDVPIFPGIESHSAKTNRLLTQVFELLKDKYPQRIFPKKEKKLENDF